MEIIIMPSHRKPRNQQTPASEKKPQTSLQEVSNQPSSSRKPALDQRNDSASLRKKALEAAEAARLKAEAQAEAVRVKAEAEEKIKAEAEAEAARVRAEEEAKRVESKVGHALDLGLKMTTDVADLLSFSLKTTKIFTSGLNLLG